MTISYPRPLYSNPTVNAQYYMPSVFNITAISKGTLTAVTTADDHNYVAGQQVRFMIPIDYGMRQLNGVEAFIVNVTASDSFEVDVNSLEFDNFSNPGTGTKAQVKAIGDVNSGILSSTGVNIPIVTILGSFRNISPN